MFELYLLDINQQVIKIIPTNKIVESVEESELNGLLKSYVSYLYEYHDENAKFFGIKSEDDSQLYRIVTEKKQGSQINLTGVHIFFDELKTTTIKDIRPKDRTVTDILDQLLEDTDWQVTYSDVTGTVSTNFYYQNKLSAFNELLELFSCEFRPVVSFANGKVSKKAIELYNRISSDKGKWFEVGHKLISVEAESDFGEIYTRFIGRGRGVETLDEDGNPTGGYGRKITFEDVEWTEPISKPKGQEYLDILESQEIYGLRTTIVDFDNIEDAEELLQATYEHALEYSRPRLQLKATGYEKHIELGEVCTVVNDKLGIRYKTRVFKVRKDHIRNSTTEFEFGERIIQSIAQRLAATKKEVAKQVNESIREINNVQLSANGFNQNFTGPDEPTAVAEGDIWYRPIGEKDWQMYQWNGLEWVLILDTSAVTEAKLAAEEVQKLIEEAESKSQQMQEEMLAKQEEVDKAIADFEEKLANIFENNPGFKQEIINEALKELDNKLKDIDIPQDKIDQALIDAGFDSSTIDDLRQKATQTSETLEMVAEIVGSDGRTTYNKNRATVTEGELPLGTEYLEVGHNGDGFEVGKTYTISWLAECIVNPSSAITYKVNTFNGVKVALELKANSPYYPTVNEELTDTKTVYGIFDDTYTLSASSDWHKEYKTTQVVSGDGEYILDLEYREIADGNLEHKYIGEWGETPTVILEGGSL